MALKIALMPSRYNRADLFEAAGFETYEAPARSPEELIDVLQDADAALVTTRPLTTRAVLEACPKLKVVSRMGVGVDSIDLPAATEQGICVCNVPGVNTAEVADHAVALLLAVTRQLSEAITAYEADEALRKNLVQHVRAEIGPIASPDLIQFAPGLPKTRSGKIMRRILRKIAEDDFSNLGDTSTLAEPAVVEDLVENRMNR